MKKSTIMFLSFCVALALKAKAQDTGNVHANGTPPRVILTQLIQTSGLQEQEVKMVIVNFAPGEDLAAHRHPIPTFGYVMEGELESTFDNKVYRYKAGDAFYERPNGLHARTRNISKDKPAKLIAFFVGDKTKPFLIPEKK